jgi:hypothetical protein
MPSLTRKICERSLRTGMVRIVVELRRFGAQSPRYSAYGTMACLFCADGMESAKFPAILRFFPSKSVNKLKPEEILQWQCPPLMS